MSSLNCPEFQQTVANFLLRHQSILDILSKTAESTSRVNRAVTKAVTTCGCLKVTAAKKPFPSEISIKDFKELFSSHLDGEVCDSCKEIIIDEIGKALFYYTALCNTLHIDLQEVLEKENSKILTLGHFNMT